MRRRRTMFARWQAVLLFLVVGFAAANDEADPIRIAVGPVLPPLLQLDDDGRPEGFVVALFRAAAQEMGRAAEFVVIDDSQGWASLNPAEVDLAVPLDPEGELPGYEYEPIHFLEIPLRRFELPGAGSDVKRADATVAVRAGSASHEYATAKHIHNVVVMPSVDAIFDALDAGTVDYVIENEYIGLAALHARGHTRIQAESERMHIEDYEYTIAHALNASEIAHDFQHALDALPVSGKHAQIWNTWFSPYHPKEVPLASFIAIALGFVCAILLLLLFVLRSHYLARAEVARQREIASAEQQRLLSIIDGAEAVAWEATLDRQFTYVNDYAESLLGYSRDSWTGSPAFWNEVLLHPDDRKRVVSASRAASRCGEDHVLEYRIVSQSGDEHWLHDFARVVHDESGCPASLRGMMIDITERKEAEARAERRRARLAAVLETSPVGMFRTDIHGNPTYANPRTFEILGQSMDEATGQGWRDAVHPDDRAAGSEAWSTAVRTQSSLDIEVRYARPVDGKTVWVICRMDPQRDPDGNVVGFVGTITDITPQKRAEEQLRLTQHTVDANSVPTFWLNEFGKIVYANAAASDTLGYSIEELLERHAWDIDAWLTSERWRARFDELRQSHAKRLESVHVRRDGSPIPVSVNLSYVEYEGIELVCGFARDISLRKQRQKALEQSEQRFRRIAENALVGVAIVGTEGFYFINETGAQLLGRSREELMALDKEEFIATLFPHDDEENQIQRSTASNAQEMPLTGMRDLRIQRPDGEIRWLSVHTGPIELDLEIGVIAVAMDISERKRAEQVLQDSARQLRNILDAMYHSVGLFELDGRMIECNEAALEVGSLQRSDVIGRPIWDAYWFSDSPYEQQRLKEAFAKAAAGETVHDDYLVRTDGERSQIVALTFGPVRDPDGEVLQVVASAVDVTEHRLAVDELRRREDLLRRTEHIAHVGGWELDTRTEALFWTDEVKQIHEVALDYQPTIEAAIAFFAPEYIEEIGELVQRAIDHREPWTVEQEIITAKGRRIWVRSTGEPVIENGKCVRLQGAFQDISKRKQAELERLEFEAQVQQAQKLESLGVLAGGIAHDFNNLLVSILGHAEIAMEEVDENESLADSVHQIETAARRAADLAKQMLAYSGKGRFDITSVDLTAMTREIAELLAVSVGKSAILHYELAENLPNIQVDASQVQQVIMNLITNASDAIGDQPGVITLRTGICEASDVDVEQFHFYDAQPAGRYAYVEVSDTGCGMDEDTRRRIFDPFYTTKFAGRGLGLAAVLGIVRGHKGALAVQSKIGKGTIFKVLFPISDVTAAPAPPVAARPADVIAGGLLVVDDERSVRDLAERALSRFGHTVFVAADGREGVNVFDANAGRIDAVLLDLTMPVMGGEETFAALRERRPDLPVLIMSGYSESEIFDRFQQGTGVVQFIQKPFQLQSLRERISGLLQALVRVPE